MKLILNPLTLCLPRGNSRDPSLVAYLSLSLLYLIWYDFHCTASRMMEAIQRKFFPVQFSIAFQSVSNEIFSTDKSCIQYVGIMLTVVD